MIKTDDTGEDTLSSDGQIKFNARNAAAHPMTTGLRPIQMEASIAQVLHDAYYAADGVRAVDAIWGIHMQAIKLW